MNELTRRVRAQETHQSLRAAALTVAAFLGGIVAVGAWLFISKGTGISP